MFPSYGVHRFATAKPVPVCWDGVSGEAIPTISVNWFHPRSSDHHPRVLARLAYDAQMLYGLFQVQDQYVVCRHTHYQDPVCTDSCVEFFVQPKPDKGYFNFEMNCGGALLLYYIEDPTPVSKPDGTTEFVRYSKVPQALGSQVAVVPSQPPLVDPEVAGPVTWSIAFGIPVKLLETYCGSIGDPQGQTWRANFYKCADGSSHPHWASWSPVGDLLRFHQPSRFGFLHFE